MAAASEPAQLTKWNGSQYEPCGAEIDNPVITDRYLSPDGVSETEHQNFAYTTTWGANLQWTAKTTTVTTTDLVTHASRVAYYTYEPRTLPAPYNAQTFVATQMPLEQTVTLGTGNPAPAQLTEDWTASQPFLPTDRKTARDGIQVGEVVSAYDANTSQLTDRQEFDGWAGQPGGALKRHTLIAYASFSQNIVDRPATVTVEGGSGAVAAQTENSYFSHGDLQSQQRLVSSGAFLTSNFTADAYGNRLAATDPAGCTSTYGYSGSTGENAYPTTITDCLNHTDTYVWNDTTGTLSSHIDPNSQTTRFSYDPWNRLTQVNYPDTGVTTYTYTATTLETRRQQDATNWMDTLETFDGLERPAVEATETTAGQWSRVDTCDNGFGEASHVSYLYTSTTSGGAAGCGQAGDSFSFDGEGRPIAITHSDGTTSLTSYKGRATETQDEGNGTARLTRIAQGDGLGELAFVCEVVASHGPTQGPGATGCGLDLAATGHLTTYTHDALGSLTTVMQGGETR